jgi:hypothetical protein
MWQSATTAPFDRDLELAVIDYDGPHTLVFPCRRILCGWVKAETTERVDVRPTHWRPWDQASDDPFRPPAGTATQGTVHSENISR